MSKKDDFEKEVKLLRYLLQTDQLLLCKAILFIHARQTPDEQAAKTTAYDNGQGWSGTDSHFMSEMAEVIKKYGELKGGQVTYSRKYIMKYAKQLIENGFQYSEAVSTNAIEESVNEDSEYLRGVIAGLSAYAHWDGGVQYVGTGGKTLSEAIDLARKGEYQ